MMARRHHVIPRFFLSGFTQQHSDDGRLHVADRVQGRSWVAGPINTAVRRDFYRVDEILDDPLVIERLLSSIEGQASLRISEIEESGALPQGEALLELLFFASSLHARTAVTRTHAERQLTTIYFDMLRTHVASEEAWQAERRRLIERGVSEAQGMTLEAMRGILDRREFNLRFASNAHAHLMIERTRATYESLAQRRWHLSRLESSAFVCSDCPVSLVWRRPGLPLDHLGLLRRETDVTVPLTSSLAMIGRFEGDPVRFDSDAAAIATVNGRTLRKATQAYSSGEQFEWKRVDGSIAGAPDFISEAPDVPDEAGAGQRGE